MVPLHGVFAPRSVHHHAIVPASETEIETDEQCTHVGRQSDAFLMRHVFERDGSECEKCGAYATGIEFHPNTIKRILESMGYARASLVQQAAV